MMIAAFLERPGHLSVKEVDKPEYGSCEALVQIRATGICGSDLHYFKEGKIGANVVEEPHILGHECAGEVVAVGAEVDHLKPGDRVTIEPGVPCCMCDLCLSGNYNLCNDVKFLGAPPNHGTFREFISHRGTFIHKLPDNISFVEGTFVEPLAVGYNAVTKAGLRPGAKVLITGAGPIGIACMLLCRIAGAGHVTITDINDYRLNLAARLGSNRTINVRELDTPSNEFDCAIEATGESEVYPTLVQAVKKKGRIVIVGMTNSVSCIDFTALMRKEVAIFTVYRYANFYRPVLKLMELGKIDVDCMVSHQFPLKAIMKAFKIADNPSENKMKIIVE
jgi:L-iditol 2-dehydrogenase